MRNLVWCTALAATLVGTAGCAGESASGDQPASATLIASWSEESEELPTGLSQELPRLVDDAADLEELQAVLEPEFDVDELASVDLDAHVLVAGDYGRCDEHSEIRAGDGGATLEFLVVEPDGADQVLCEWSPGQIDVWQVERDGLDPDVVLVDAPA